MGMTDRELFQMARDALYAMQQAALEAHCGLKICDDTIIKLDAHLSRPEARAALAAPATEPTLDGGSFHEIKKIYKAIIAVGSGK